MGWDCISDGILEARNPQGELWDSSRITQILSEKSSLRANEILASLIEAVDEYAGGSDQSDDITAVVLRIGGR